MSQALETTAIEAHRAGMSWAGFWGQHSAQIRQAQPWRRPAYHRLVNRLMHLLLTGDGAGQFPPEDPDGIESWDRDDAAEQPHETQTCACLQIDLPMGAEVAT